MTTNIHIEPNKHNYNHIPLHEWKEALEQKQMQEHFQDKDSFYKAFTAIFDLNKMDHSSENDICKNRKPIEKAFNNILFPINNNQLATSMILANYLETQPRVLCQMGAGMGKSRVAAALAFHMLTTTKREVYLVFSDEGLLNRDQEQCKDLWKYTGITNKNDMKRLHHVVGIDDLPTTKKCVIIIDESDDIIMRNPVLFAKKTMGKSKSIVCLTATPDDGVEEGSERNLLNMMGYKLLRTGEKKEMVAPVINQHVPMESA